MVSRRGVGSLIGIGFLLMILALGFSYYNLSIRVEERRIDVLTEVSERDRDAADENLDIQSVALTVGNSLNLTIKNTGNVFSEIEWIGVIDETLSTQEYYRTTASLNPVETQKDIGNSSISMNPSNTYTIQVLTKLGNIYYGEYPEPTTGGSGGSANETQYFFVDLTGDNYAPTELGTHSLFSAMKAGPDYINDTLTEGQSAFSGEIGDSTVDSLEFDTGAGRYPDIINVSGDIYAIAYQGGGNDGWLATVDVDSSGQIENSVIDSYEFDTGNGRYPDIVHVSGDIYAIATTGGGDDGFIDTVDIDSAGTITNSIIDSIEYNTGNGEHPSFVHVSGDIFAVAYRGPTDDGWLTTVEIDSAGTITNTVVDTLEFDVDNCLWPHLIHISGDYYAIAHTGQDNDGFIRTVEIASNGQITNTVVDSYEFDTTRGDECFILPISGDIYAVAYSDTNNFGQLFTVDISTTGVITASKIDTLEFDSTEGYFPTMSTIQGDYYSIAYHGLQTDGYVVTVEIQSNGQIGASTLDSFEFDTDKGENPLIVSLSSQYSMIVYRGTDNDGFIVTVEFVGAMGLDLEVSWTGLPSKTNEFLVIYGGVMGAETLQVDYWNGASWVNVIPSLTSGYNIVDISSYLTGSSFTIRFVDSVQLGDTTQDTWDIDAVYLNLFD